MIWFALAILAAVVLGPLAFTLRRTATTRGRREAAIALHQSGRIPPNTWVIDLDGVAANARILAAEARRLGLHTYVMGKQYGRNTYVSAVALANGLHRMVAVDMQGALLLHRYGLPVGLGEERDDARRQHQGKEG